MKRLAALLLALIAASSASGDEHFKLQGATPQVINLLPGGSPARAAIFGRGLDQIMDARIYRDDREVEDFDVRLGARSPALRDIFVSPHRNTRPGDYQIRVRVGDQYYAIATLVHVAMPPDTNRPGVEPSGIFNPALEVLRNAERAPH